MYGRLYEGYMYEKNRKEALKLLTFWDTSFPTTVDLSAYEQLIGLFVKENEYTEALGVLNIAKKKGERLFDVEILLLLKLGKYGSIIPVFREAFAANYSIKEIVGISVVKKLFELTRIEENRILDVTSKYMKLTDSIDGGNGSGSGSGSGSSATLTSIISNVASSLTPEESELIVQHTENIETIIADIEEITSNLVYVERGSVESFNMLIRLWREGGETHKERLQV